jgi:hypothetical protein
LNRNSKSTKALVYVDYGVKFSGFSVADRTIFQNYGITEVVVYRSYSEEQMLLINDFRKYSWRPASGTPRNNGTPRNGTPRNGTANGTGSNAGGNAGGNDGDNQWGNWWVWLLVIAVIIAVVILVCYYVCDASSGSWFEHLTNNSPPRPRNRGSRYSYPVVDSQRSPFLFF